jgi:hypothetical protein
MTLKTIDNFLVKISTIMAICFATLMGIAFLLMPVFGSIGIIYISDNIYNKIDRNYPGIAGLASTLTFLSLSALQILFWYCILFTRWHK